MFPSAVIASNDDHPTAYTVPHPVLFNTWKHHAGWVREQIREVGAGGEFELTRLAEKVVVCGTKLMDFYFGPLSPWQLGEQAVAAMQRLGITDFAALQVWLQPQGGYSGFDVPDDGSRWIVRAGEEQGRYLHLHPGRYSPHTVRVSGLTLKSAIVSLAFSRQSGRDPHDVHTVNDVRKRWLALPPINALDPEQGLGEFLLLLHRGL